MLVRLKKRGEMPVTHSVIGATETVSAIRPLDQIFRGCVIDVEPAPQIPSFTCGGDVFEITDGRVLPFYWEIKGVIPCICSHYLIDDLNAYDSDSCDEQAEVGDLACSAVPVTVAVK